jgi:hypothetical protein
MKFGAPKNGSIKIDAAVKRTSFIGHLGLIAGLFWELGIDKLIDEKLPKKRDNKVPHSICILAMVRQEVVSKIADQSAPFLFGVSLVWHAFLVTGRCEAHKTTRKRMEP